MRDLSSGVGSYLKRTPKAEELRRALARDEDKDGILPRSTYGGWIKDTGKGAGLDRTVDSLTRVASFYHGQETADGDIVDGREMFEFLRRYFGHLIEGEERADFPPARTMTATRTRTKPAKTKNLDLGAFGE